ncbi:hypothetical protein AKJ43_01865 [candidate division MSBL1 archaeon SCGC-AAA261D19]|uniref:Uncharacterized protein n=1 Tax=candidate division MSBL1 archaeon SCGC-AAA261D19 TaxID=1698273 RepID=A0A133V7E1_9EURY|nr:hypothetical protein AKJ43_01865 [candidate division MSBL1 archaeon SCGC-AAA261D19]
MEKSGQSGGEHRSNRSPGGFGVQGFRDNGRRAVEAERGIKRIFLYAKIFGLIKMPSEEESAREVHKSLEFLDWGREAIDAAGFLNTWDDMGKIAVPLASEEDSFAVDPQSEELVRSGAPEIVGS